VADPERIKQLLDSLESTMDELAELTAEVGSFSPLPAMFYWGTDRKLLRLDAVNDLEIMGYRELYILRAMITMAAASAATELTRRSRVQVDDYPLRDWMAGTRVPNPSHCRPLEE
jgi:hypothetical protein